MDFSGKQRKEAIRRMETLEKTFHLNPKLMKYLKEGKVYYSYMVSGMFGCIDTIHYDENFAAIVKNFEEETGNYVYHVIETNSQFGKMLNLLYVSQNEDNWAVERLESGFLSCYVYNMDDKCGEYGDIFLTSDNGALLRWA